MQISKDYVMREIAGDHIIVPTGKEALKFQGLIIVDEVGALIWRLLQEKDLSLQELEEVIVNEYDVSKETASKDINEFLKQLISKEMLIYNQETEE